MYLVSSAVGTTETAFQQNLSNLVEFSCTEPSTDFNWFLLFRDYEAFYFLPNNLGPSGGSPAL